jgi:hypothetical protein
MCVAAVALDGGIVPEGKAGAVARELVREVEEGQLVENGTRVYPGRSVCGLVGVRSLFPALALAGRADLAVSAILGGSGREFPSYGFMLARGATTLWEHWEEACVDPTGKIPCDTEDSSSNHVMFGSVATWLVEEVGGVKQVNVSRVVFWPRVAALIGRGRGDERGFGEEAREGKVEVERVGRGRVGKGVTLDHGRGELDLLCCGVAICDWKFSEVSGAEHVQYQISIPVGATAELRIEGCPEGGEGEGAGGCLVKESGW